MEDILAVILLFGGGTLFLLSISPIGKAIAERIRARAPVLPPGVEDQLDGVLEELSSLRRELTEVQERVDFTEQMLARDRSAARLPPRPPSGAVEE